MSSGDDDHLDPSHPKKRKIQRACDTCRRKKSSGPQPPDHRCTSCVEYNIDCTYEDAPKKRGRPKGYVEGLENRVQKLESLLKKMYLFSSIDPEDSSRLSKMPSSTSASVSSPGSLASPLSPAPSSDEAATNAVLDMIHRIAAITLGPQDDPFRDDDFEHVVLSERMKLLSMEPDDARFFGKTAILFKNERVLEGRRPMFWTRRPWEQELFSCPTPNYTFPPPDLINDLVEATLNMSTFLPTPPQTDLRARIADNLHLRDAGFGGVLLLACAVGTRYIEKLDERTLMDGYYNQVQVVKQRLLEPPTLYDLQSYCLAVEFLQGCFAPHACWILVGIGIRLAQDVGAHRRRVPREKLTVEDELWKRAFWVLVMMDRMSSMGMGRPCAILDDDFDLDMPVECDDEFRQPPGVPSTVTAFNQHLRLNKIMAFALYSIYSIKTKFWEFILRQPSPLAFPSLAICTSAARSCALVLEQQMKRTTVVYPYMQLSAVTAGIRSGVAADPKAMRQVEICMDALSRAEERWHTAGLLLDILNELASVGELILPEDDPGLVVNSERKGKAQALVEEWSTEGCTDTDSGLPSGSTMPDPLQLHQPYTVPQYLPEHQSRVAQHMFGESNSMRLPPYSAYPSSGDMPDLMGTSSAFQSEGTRSRQQAIVDTNTMAMWLNAPTGFEFNEWGTFLTNVTELTSDMSNAQQSDLQGSESFRMY
ncbi:fungal-specific transcription factor domain-containing protein [Cyathus striatus]|nr:fungal-specific transcription factor domain-containing protein [Cyathus striatus]